MGALMCDSDCACVCVCVVACGQGGQHGDPVTQDRQKQSFSSYTVFFET